MREDEDMIMRKRMMESQSMRSSDTPELGGIGGV
jgi:hypothetical protein